MSSKQINESKPLTPVEAAAPVEDIAVLIENAVKAINEKWTIETTENVEAEIERRLFNANGAWRSEQRKQGPVAMAELAALVSILRKDKTNDILIPMVSNTDRAAVFHNYFNHRVIKDVADSIVEKLDKNGVFECYELRFTPVFIKFEQLDNAFYEVNKKELGKDAKLATVGNYAKYADIFAYNTALFRMTKENHTDWKRATLSEDNLTILRGLMASEKGKKAKEMAWTNCTTRDKWDNMLMAFIAAFLPADFELPSIRAVDREWLRSRIVTPGLNRRREPCYSYAKTSSVVNDLFAMLEKAMNGTAYDVTGGKKSFADTTTANDDKTAK